jgi:copper/silver efflux system protein
LTIDKLIAEFDRSLQFPGVSNAWTMPIKARIDMLSTGIRTPVGVKVFGTDLAAYAERVIGGYYLNIELRLPRIPANDLRSGMEFRSSRSMVRNTRRKIAHSASCYP